MPQQQRVLMAIGVAALATAPVARLEIGSCTIEHDDADPYNLNSTCAIRSAETEELRAEVARLTALVEERLTNLPPTAPPLPAAPPPPRPPPVLTTAQYEPCGVASNPTSWLVNNVGMLGTHMTHYDDDNWSVDCRVSVLNAITAAASAGSSSPLQISMRLFDPVDSSHMDLEYTFAAQEWYDAFQTPDASINEATLPSGSVVLPSSASAGFLSHKAYAVGTALNPPVARILSRPSYIQSYCNGGAAARYSGTGSTSAFNFLVGGGGQVHATICSTGLGMYGPSACTSGYTTHPCYLGSSTVCNAVSSTTATSTCFSDAAQRAAISLKLV